MNKSKLILISIAVLVCLTVGGSVSWYYLHILPTQNAEKLQMELRRHEIELASKAKEEAENVEKDTNAKATTQATAEKKVADEKSKAVAEVAKQAEEDRKEKDEMKNKLNECLGYVNLDAQIAASKAEESKSFCINYYPGVGSCLDDALAKLKRDNGDLEKREAKCYQQYQ